jgi:hypothetical protein
MNTEIVNKVIALSKLMPVITVLRLRANPIKKTLMLTTAGIPDVQIDNSDICVAIKKSSISIPKVVNIPKTYLESRPMIQPRKEIIRDLAYYCSRYVKLRNMYIQHMKITQAEFDINNSYGVILEGYIAFLANKKDEITKILIEKYKYTPSMFVALTKS